MTVRELIAELSRHLPDEQVIISGRYYCALEISDGSTIDIEEDGL